MTKARKSSPPVKFDPPDRYRSGESVRAVGDLRTGAVYVFTDKVRLAVRVALATGRPLLLRGASGWGKSSLAASAAKYLGWEYREFVVTARTQARDFGWEVDLLKRLSDAQANKLNPDWRVYLKPRVLWWAFDPVSAAEQERIFGGRSTSGTSAQDEDEAPRSVVLIDEIDKADPDVPNNLLVALGSLQFKVDELDVVIKADPDRAPLVMITSNDERALPPAFLRRCIQLELPAFDGDKEIGDLKKAMLVDIGEEHFRDRATREYVQKIADALMPDTASPIPSPAEFVDVTRAALELAGGAPKADAIRQIANITFASAGRPEAR